LAYNWAVNELEEREILRVSVVNERGFVLFDSVVQPSKPLKYVPLYNMHLYDASFGIPLRYLAEMLNLVLDKKIVVGYQLEKLFSGLTLSCVYTLRDVAINDQIGINSPSNLARTFFDFSLDPFFRSTITEARLYMSLYKNFQTEIDDYYLKFEIMEEVYDQEELPILKAEEESLEQDV